MLGSKLVHARARLDLANKGTIVTSVYRCVAFGGVQSLLCRLAIDIQHSGNREDQIRALSSRQTRSIGCGVTTAGGITTSSRNLSRLEIIGAGTARKRVMVSGRSVPGNIPADSRRRLACGSLAP